MEIIKCDKHNETSRSFSYMWFIHSLDEFYTYIRLLKTSQYYFQVPVPVFNMKLIIVLTTAVLLSLASVDCVKLHHHTPSALIRCRNKTENNLNFIVMSLYDIYLYIYTHSSCSLHSAVCLTLIPAWIINYIPRKVWGEITYPFLERLHRGSLWMDK